MKFICGVVFLISCTTSIAQTQAVRKKAEAASFTPKSLSEMLTAPHTTELEKVRSIFYWITDNISYNTLRYRPGPGTYIDDGFESMHDDDSVLQPLDDRVAEVVLRRKYALCDGYARLFKSLCDHAGIKSVVIGGYARTNYGSQQFRCNHKWNAVMIDSNWYLLDATWASGYLSYSGNTFIKNYNGSYFMSPPRYFANDHYPDDLRWMLLEDPPEPGEFKHSPFKQPDFNYRISAYWPEKGIISAAVGDTLIVRLRTSDDRQTVLLLDKDFVDSADIDAADSLHKANTAKPSADGLVTAQYIVSTEATQWLQVLYNGKPVLRYKMNVRKKPFSYPPIIIKEIAAATGP